MRIASTILTLALTGCLSFASKAQDGKSAEAQSTLNSYLQGVAKGNLSFIAERLNVSVAEAELKASKVFPDPEVSIAYSNNQNQTLHMGQSVETSISYPFSLGNKRGAAVSLASSQYDLSQLMLDEYFKNLRANAALTYYTALKQQEVVKLQQDTYLQLLKLAQADSLRHRLGEATELDALQSMVEAKSQLNEVYQSVATLQNGMVDLVRFLGKRPGDTLVTPTGSFPLSSRIFSLENLIEKAINERESIKIAAKNKEISERNLRAIKADRAFEFSIEAGYSQNSVVTNETAPAPAYHTLSAGISIPLKFSNFNRGAVNAGKLQIQQSEITCQDVKQQIAAEVTQAYNQFIAMQKQLNHYSTGLVESADKVLKGKIYAYQRGETSLVEVINAQHTYNDLSNSYWETVIGYTSALIELERVSGIWDLS